MMEDERNDNRSQSTQPLNLWGTSFNYQNTQNQNYSDEEEIQTPRDPEKEEEKKGYNQKELINVFDRIKKNPPSGFDGGYFFHKKSGKEIAEIRTGTDVRFSKNNPMYSMEMHALSVFATSNGLGEIRYASVGDEATFISDVDVPKGEPPVACMLRSSGIPPPVGLWAADMMVRRRFENKDEDMIPAVSSQESLATSNKSLFTKIREFKIIKEEPSPTNALYDQKFKKGPFETMKDQKTKTKALNTITYNDCVNWIASSILGTAPWIFVVRNEINDVTSNSPSKRKSNRSMNMKVKKGWMEGYKNKFSNPKTLPHQFAICFKNDGTMKTLPDFNKILSVITKAEKLAMLFEDRPSQLELDEMYIRWIDKYSIIFPTLSKMENSICYDQSLELLCHWVDLLIDDTESSNIQQK